MYCMSCGQKLPDNVKFCQYCGNAVKPRTAAASTASGDSAPQGGSADTPTVAQPPAAAPARKKRHPVLRVLLTILWVTAASVAALFFGVLFGYAVGGGITGAAAATADTPKAYVSINECSIDTVDCTVRCSPSCGRVEVYAVLYAEDGVLTLTSTEPLLTFDADESADLLHFSLALNDADYEITKKTFTADDGTVLSEGAVESLASYIGRGMMVRMVSVQLVCGDVVVGSARETLHC